MSFDDDCRDACWSKYRDELLASGVITPAEPTEPQPEPPPAPREDLGERYGYAAPTKRPRKRR